MTALGKMMTFLVFILAAVWVFFSVNAYVTRVNWEARALKAEKLNKEYADSATKMKELYEAREAAYAEQLRSTQSERARIYDQIAELAKERDSLQAQFNQAFGNAQQANVQIKNLQTNLKSVQDQIDELDKSVTAKNKEINELIKKAEGATVAAGESNRTAVEFRQQAERLGERLQELNELLQEYRRQYGPPQQQLGRAPAVPEGFRGTVDTVTKGEGNDVIVTLKPGADAGVQKGAMLTVWGPRNGAPRHLGTIVILSTEPKESVGRFVPAAPIRGVPQADDLPKAGDEVKAK